MISVVKEISVDGGVTFVPAGTPPGPTLVSPTAPVYRFVVTNTGTAHLVDITLVDNTLGPITLPTTILGPGQSFTTDPVTGVFGLGEHSNVVTASGTTLSEPVTATGTAFFTGVAQPGPGLTLVKEISVSGPGGPFVPAPVAPGPTLFSPTAPVYQFVVTNSSAFDATNVTVTDATLGFTQLIGTMPPGQTLTVGPVSGLFQLGEHCNTATASGFIEGEPVSASSTACFFGVAQPTSCLVVEKLISVHGLCGPFVATPTPPGVELFAPTNPAFRFIVTNHCPVHVIHITLVDSVLGPIAIPTTILGPGQSFTVTVCGAFAPGLHCNTATVSGVAAGVPVTSSSTACFFGVTSPVPVFPDISGPAPQPQIIDRLLETVALEELALAALINAEAEKVQAVAAAGVAGPVQPEELAAINTAVAAVIAQAAAKEEALLRKLTRILSHKERCISPCG